MKSQEKLILVMLMMFFVGLGGIGGWGLRCMTTADRLKTSKARLFDEERAYNKMLIETMMAEASKP